MPCDPDPPGVPGDQRALAVRLRAVVEAKDIELAALRADLEAERELIRGLELRIAELERRLGQERSDSGTPTSKEADRGEGDAAGAAAVRAGAQEGPHAGRAAGACGKSLSRDPDPSETKAADPPAECRRCRAGLDGADAIEPRWAQVIDVEAVRAVTEWLLPGLACPCCGTVTFAQPQPGAYSGAVCYGPVLNAAAVLVADGNVPPERAAAVHEHAAGDSGAGRVDKAADRISAQLGKATASPPWTSCPETTSPHSCTARRPVAKNRLKTLARRHQLKARVSPASRSLTSMRAKPRRFSPSHCDGRTARLSAARPMPKPGLPGWPPQERFPPWRPEMPAGRGAARIWRYSPRPR